jgi:hypothetical protein
MTPEDITKLTIADVEAICERAEKALSAFREARAALGAVAAPIAAERPQLEPAVALKQKLTPAEEAEKRRLMIAIRGEMPPEIQRAMGDD